MNTTRDARYYSGVWAITLLYNSIKLKNMIRKFFLSVILCVECVFAMAQSQTVTHIVQRGETIESIAEHYKVSVADINKANPDTDGIIYVGMKLNIPASTSPQKETKLQPSPNGSNSSNEIGTIVSQSTYTTEKHIGADDIETTLGFHFPRVKASYLFPTKLEKSTRGHYRSSYNLSFLLEGEYVFKSNAFAGFGLGYMVQGSCNSDRDQDEDGIRYQEYENQYHYVTVPLSIGYRMPITQNTNLDIYTGPVVTCVAAGYAQNRASVSEEWDKKKLKDIKNVKYCVPFWNVGARINLWMVELGAEYWFLLAKTNEGGSKRAIAACLSFHM